MVPKTEHVVNGYTLLGIFLCKEGLRRKYALEKTLEKAHDQNAQIYRSIFSSQANESSQNEPLREAPVVQTAAEQQPKKNTAPEESSKCVNSRPVFDAPPPPPPQLSHSHSQTQLRSQSQSQLGPQPQQRPQPQQKPSPLKILSEITAANRRRKEAREAYALTEKTSPRTSIRQLLVPRERSFVKTGSNRQNTDTPAPSASAHGNLQSDAYPQPKKRCKLCGLVIPPSKECVKKERERRHRCKCAINNAVRQIEKGAIRSKGRPARRHREEMSDRLPTSRGGSISGLNNDGKMKGKHKKRSSGSLSSPRKGSKTNGVNAIGAGRPAESFLCTCSTCCGQTTCCCVEDLQAIEEEHQSETQLSDKCEQCFKEPCPANHMQPYPGNGNACPFTCPCNKLDGEKRSSLKGGPDHRTTKTPEDEDSCGEFFEIMRDTMEDAVKKSLEGVFAQYFNCCYEKIDNLCRQIERNECILTKVYTDLNDKIAYYGERNAQQFQYLCVRMEHDRLFYQQQQEYFLKGRKDQNEQEQDDCGSNVRCTVQKCAARCVAEEKHSKSRVWECNLVPDEQFEGVNDDGENSESEKQVRASVSSQSDVKHKRSDGSQDAKLEKKPEKKKK